MSDEERGFISTKVLGKTEEQVELSLRPVKLDEVIGREKEKKNIELMIEASKKRNKPIDHLLFHGPPGLGKTSFAHVIAREMGVNIVVTNGTVLDKAGDLAAILTSLEDKGILFIDEIHRLRSHVEEMLYPAMEDNVLDIIIGKGPSAKTLRMDLPQFTIIGATTKLSGMSGPLRDRFGMHVRLDYFSDNDLAALVLQKAKKMSIDITNEAALEIAKRSRMTARIAIRILKRSRDLAVVKNRDQIDQEIVKDVFQLLNLNDDGLDELDKEILRVMYYNFGIKPVGLKTLAIAVSEEPETIEQVYEPYLIKKGFIKRTPKGRVVTDIAIKYMEEILGLSI